VAKKRWLAAVSLLGLLAGTPAFAQSLAKSSGSKAPVLVTADQFEHDRDRNVVTAIGNVEIAQEGRVLKADKVVYDMNADRVFAAGNVAVLEPNGDVMFADKSEVTGDLKTGVAEQVRILMTNEARMAANVSRRTGGVVTEMEQATYTACEPCKDHPERPLLWELQADQVVHDQQTHDIVFYDAWFNVFGYPIFYTPWFSSPDATVKRRSGFMPPTVGHNSDIGNTLSVPYYWAISPQEDLLFTPRFSDKQLPILAFEHRKVFRFGEMETNASITQDENGDTRGHIRGKGKFSINENFRAGYEIALTSDETYLKRYEFVNSGLPFLTNRPYMEAFFGERSYALAESFYFQGQRSTDIQGDIPIVAPLMSYTYVGQPGAAFGGRWGMDANFVQLTRTDGYDSLRAYVRPYWTMPYTSSRGEVYTFTAALPSVLERYNDFNNTDSTIGHSIPEATVDWRYPFVRIGQKSQQVIEPIVQAVLAPHWTGNTKNPDSLTFDFTDTSLFQLSHFAGYDGYSSGPRVNYALKYSLHGWGTADATAMIGQSYRVYADDGLSAGLDQNLSDIVGRLSLTPSRNIDLYYRFLLGKNDLALLRSEVTTVLGPPAFRFTADYSLIDKSVATVTGQTSEEVTLALSSAISQRWSVSAFTRYDLVEGGGLLYDGGSVTYDDECFTASLNFINKRTSDTDISTGQTFLLRLVFKTLGEAPVKIH
jgi:LPS-assembly protein